MKVVSDRPFADPDAAARKLIELANAFEPVQDGRIEKANGLFLFELKGTPAEYTGGLAALEGIGHGKAVSKLVATYTCRPKWPKLRGGGVVGEPFYGRDFLDRPGGRCGAQFRRFHRCESHTAQYRCVFGQAQACLSRKEKRSCTAAASHYY